MLKLMKYELRKSWLSKVILLSALGVSELVFLAGIFLTDPSESPYTAIGIAALVICTIAGLSFVGIESILTLHKDLNTKQSYMLFMTPNSGYKILGAKILENALTIVITSLAFLALAALDIGILITKLGGLKEAINLVQQVLDLEIRWNDIALQSAFAFGDVVISWFAMIVTGYLAVILVAAVLAGKRFSGAAAFVLFIILTIARERMLNVINDLIGGGYTTVSGFVIYLLLNLVFAVAVYLASGWMVEKKLSV